MIRDLLPGLARGERLTREATASAVGAMMRGEAADAEVGAFLTALALRGESEEELIGAAEALRAAAMAFPVRHPRLLDTCGTGGDGTGTYNISTGVALVAAAAGVPVAKHGNRSVSSRCGSADVLEALGARIDLGPEDAARALEETNFTFLYAPRFHPAMRHVAAVRRALGIRTLFNWIGPLANPARASHQLLGIPDPGRLEGVARVVRSLGAARAMVVHGAGGMDELSLEGESLGIEVSRGEDALRRHSIDPGTLGLDPAPAAALRGGDAAENASLLRGILSGAQGPRRDVLVLNAAAALYVAEAAASLADGVTIAADTIDSGAARDTLERYVDRSRRSSGG